MKKVLSLVLLSTLLTDCVDDVNTRRINSMNNHLGRNTIKIKSSSAKNALRANPNFQLLCQAANEGAL